MSKKSGVLIFSRCARSVRSGCHGAMPFFLLSAKRCRTMRSACGPWGLTYVTLLALVPLLAVMFAVLKTFGVHNLIEPSLAQALEPLGEQGAEITRRVLEFVSNLRVGVLGAVGVATLFYTVVSLISKN